MSLDQYRTAAFTQGPLVRQEYLYKPEVANGVCFALLVEWMKLTPLFGANDQDPTTRINTINENFKLAGSRHLMSKTGIADTKQQDHADQIKTLWSSQASQEYAQILTDLGKHSGVAFKFMRELAQRDNLPTVISHQASKGRGFSFVTDLWDAYANTRGGINTYILYAISQQETIPGEMGRG